MQVFSRRKNKAGVVCVQYTSLHGSGWCQHNVQCTAIHVEGLNAGASEEFVNFRNAPVPFVKQG
jgi:hypothetical protein